MSSRDLRIRKLRHKPFLKTPKVCSMQAILVSGRPNRRPPIVLLAPRFFNRCGACRGLVTTRSGITSNGAVRLRPLKALPRMEGHPSGATSSRARVAERDATCLLGGQLVRLLALRALAPVTAVRPARRRPLQAQRSGELVLDLVSDLRVLAQEGLGVVAPLA